MFICPAWIWVKSLEICNTISAQQRRETILVIGDPEAARPLKYFHGVGIAAGTTRCLSGISVWCWLDSIPNRPEARVYSCLSGASRLLSLSVPRWGERNQNYWYAKGICLARRDKWAESRWRHYVEGSQRGTFWSSVFDNKGIRYASWQLCSSSERNKRREVN